MLSGVSDRTLHIAIDVTFVDEQIQGHIRDSGRQPKPFSGWLGLIAALDGILTPPNQQGEHSGALPRAAAPERRE
jgi:hypothetical protein